MTADSGKESRELRNLRSLAGHSQGKYIVQLLDEFLHHGPNGSHQCLVFELLGPSLDTIVAEYGEGGDRLEPETVLKISQQLLQAIALIHDVGYSHGGMIGYGR
jgi:serine/threonine-protein kinase SRPK3